jgi:hypothetical protein
MEVAVGLEPATSPTYAVPIPIEMLTLALIPMPRDHSDGSQTPNYGRGR